MNSLTSVDLCFCQSTNSRRKQQVRTNLKTKEENCLNFPKIILKMYLKIETILISILKYDIQLIFVRTKIRSKIRTFLEIQPESKPEYKIHAATTHLIGSCRYR